MSLRSSRCNLLLLALAFGGFFTFTAPTQAITSTSTSGIDMHVPVGELAPQPPDTGCYMVDIDGVHGEIRANGLSCKIIMRHFGMLGLEEKPGGIYAGVIEVFGSSMEVTLDCADETRVFHFNADSVVHAGLQDAQLTYQTIPTTMHSLTGETSNDLFESFRLVAGDAFGMVSPGQTTFRRTGPETVHMDSWFMIGFRVEWEGAAGGPFAGQSGVAEGRVPMVLRPNPPGTGQ